MRPSNRKAQTLVNTVKDTEALTTLQIIRNRPPAMQRLIY